MAPPTGVAHSPRAPRPAPVTSVVAVPGSSQETGRLDLAKKSLDTMTDKLRDDDSVAIVTFSDQAERVLPMTRLGGHRGRIHEAIDSLEPTYSTNLGAGVEKGYATAVDGRRKNATNRVVLISDALANDGGRVSGELAALDQALEVLEGRLQIMAHNTAALFCHLKKRVDRFLAKVIPSVFPQVQTEAS